MYFLEKISWKWITVAIIVAIVLVMGFLLWPLTPKNSGQQNGGLSSQNQDTTFQPEATKPAIINSADQKYSAFIELDGASYCNFHVVNNETKSDTIIKRLSYSERGETQDCYFSHIHSFSPDNSVLMINSGTDVIHAFEIINIATQKSVATFQAASMNGWINENEFVFAEPFEFESQADMRPWGAGYGMSIVKLNVNTGNKTVLKKADSTHDYFLEVNPDGTLVGSDSKLWILVQTYPLSSGSDRFLKPEMNHWIMDYSGNLIQNIDDYERYQ